MPKSLDLPLRYVYLLITGRLDYELAVLRTERPDCYRAIDIGTNIGIYSYGFSRFCQEVESFEPVIGCTAMLRAYARVRGHINVNNVGLSNQAGNTNLYVPYIDKSTTQNVGLASINDPYGNRDVISIEIRRLDDYNFNKVGIIKIDVEGHEFEVLQGAAETISREKPILLVEIEQRHLKDRNIEDVFKYILSFGYNGGYYYKKRFYPLGSFKVEDNQMQFLDRLYSDEYINNFIFRPI